METKTRYSEDNLYQLGIWPIMHSGNTPANVPAILKSVANGDSPSALTLENWNNSRWHFQINAPFMPSGIKTSPVLHSIGSIGLATGIDLEAGKKEFDTYIESWKSFLIDFPAIKDEMLAAVDREIKDLYNEILRARRGSIVDNSREAIITYERNLFKKMKKSLK